MNEKPVYLKIFYFLNKNIKFKFVYERKQEQQL